MSNAFHVSLNVRSIPEASERYRKILGVEPAKVRADYAKADKFWVRDADGMAWEMYAFLADSDSYSEPEPAPAPTATKSGCCAA